MTQVSTNTTDAATVQSPPQASTDGPARPRDPVEAPRSLTMPELRAFRKVSPWRASADIALSWALIAGLFAVIWWKPTWWMLLALSPVLGAFQNRLTTLLHDAMHRSLHPKPRVSDFLGKWLLSYPVGNFFHTNIIQHADHHNRFGEQADPNVMAYTVSRETFVKRDLPKSLLCLHMFSALLNFNQKIANKFRFSAKESAISDAERKLKREALRKDYLRLPLVHLAMFGIFYACSIWWAYFYFMIVRVTWCAAFNQIRLFVEHHSDICDADPILADTADPSHPLVDTLPGLLERFFIAPLNFNLHGTHHVAPFVPYYQLPELAELCRQRGLKYVINRKGYLGYVFGRDTYAAEERTLIPLDH